MWVKAGLLPLLLSFLAALVLMVLPLPPLLEIWRPDWLTLVLMYWLVALPHRVGFVTVLILGLLTDILMGSGFGIYTIALLVIAYPVLSNFQRLLNQSLLQQTLFIGLLVLVKRAIVYQLEHVLNDAVFNLPYLYPVLTSMVAWPWVYLLLRKYRRRYVIR